MNAGSDGYGTNYLSVHVTRETPGTTVSPHSDLYMTRSKIDVPQRILGSTLVIVGWYMLIHTHTPVGMGLSLVGDTIAIPYFLRTRAWDVVVMICVLHVGTAHKLAQGLFTSGAL